MNVSNIAATQTVGIRVPTGHILVNSRWSGSSLISDLQASVPVHFEESESAIDFYPTCNAGVVYVSEAELVEGHAYKCRVARLRKARRVQGIVMVEKTPSTSQYFKDVQKFCVYDLGMDLIPIGNQNEAAGFLTQLVHVESSLQKNPFLKPSQHLQKDQSILLTLMTCPGLGNVKANTLLDKFSSLELICKANKEELAAVIGQGSANKVYNFFHGSS